MIILVLLSGIALLLCLIGLLKFNAFIALIITALYVGIVSGMPLAQVVKSATDGIGNTLGPLVLVLGLGAVFGSLLTESGAAMQISTGLIKLFGIRYVKAAMLLTGFAVGIALFYNAGFVVLVPLIFTVAAQTGLPLPYLAISTASALSVTHGFLPPHPGPTAIAGILKADIGKTLLYGLLISIPTLVLAGLIFPEFIRKIKAAPTMVFRQEHIENAPPFAVSLLLALVPVLLMGSATAIHLFLPGSSRLQNGIQFIGDASIALLIAVVVALALLCGVYQNRMQTLMDKCTVSISAIAGIILIIGAGGAFKQILTDSGIGKAIAGYFEHATLSPLFLGWLVALLIRVSIGSATIAGLMAAGIVVPLVQHLPVSPELMVLSIGAGSLMCSHVNDSGFWMFKEYMGLSLADTFRTWTVMECIIGITGLGGVLLLSLFIHP